MNLPSALIKQVLELGDFDTWNRVRKHYLPAEYHLLYDSIEKHVTKYHKLPKVGELKLSVRDSATLDKVYALEGIDTDAEPFLLLDYLKNEYAQKEVLFQLDKYIEKSIAFESAEEVVKSLQAISVEIEKKVEIKPESESMQRINLFDDEDALAKRITLGLNAAFDAEYNFNSTDYILMGGKRGSGKSLTVVNLAYNIIHNYKKSFILFSVEMPVKEVLQRYVAVATGIPYKKIRNKNLSVPEWDRLVEFWASRYENGDEYVKQYKEHRSFNTFHSHISREELIGPQIHIIYDPSLTIPAMKAEVDKLLALGEEIGAIGVDYINQVALKSGGGRIYDWTEQIEVSKSLKAIAGEYAIPVFSPYQTDATGEARFAKGILDSADAAMVLEAHDDCISFTVTKMRHADDDVIFTSKMDWSCLRIGPDSATPPEKEEKKAKEKVGKAGERMVKGEVYDDDDVPIMDASYAPPF